MHALLRATSAFASGLLGLALFAAPAAAEDCTYTDIQGTFAVSVDCGGLEDHSNLGNEQKRLWLAGGWGQVNIIEVPPPYKQDAGQIDLVMSNLGRIYTARRSPGGVQQTTVAGQDALVILEHKMRTSSRSWVFHWEGRNLIMRAVAFGKKRERMARLDTMSEALTSSFAAANGKALSQVDKMRNQERGDARPLSAGGLTPAEKRAKKTNDEPVENSKRKYEKEATKAGEAIETKVDEATDEGEEEAEEIEDEAQEEVEEAVEDATDTTDPDAPIPVP